MRIKKYIFPSICLILAACCIYLQRSYRNLEIAFNRTKREHKMLVDDYDKLYRAYYEYEAKVQAFLSLNGKILWMQDSTAYVLVKEEQHFFSFFRKPGGHEQMFLDVEPNDSINGQLSSSVFRVDSLKPHQYFTFSKDQGAYVYFLVDDKGNNLGSFN